MPTKTISKPKSTKNQKPSDSDSLKRIADELSESFESLLAKVDQVNKANAAKAKKKKSNVTFAKEIVAEEDVQEVLINLTNYAGVRFQDLRCCILNQQNNEPPRMIVNGNIRYKAFFPHHPDAWAVVESLHRFPNEQNEQNEQQEHTIHNLFCIGEAKDSKHKIATPLAEIYYKGSLVSPLFGYMCIFIAITPTEAEIGLYSPLYRSTSTSTSIYSQHFDFSKGYPVLAEMVYLLDFLVRFLFKVYEITSLSSSFDQMEFVIDLDKNLKTYLLYVKELQLPADFGSLCLQIGSKSHVLKRSSFKPQVDVTQLSFDEPQVAVDVTGIIQGVTSYSTQVYSRQAIKSTASRQTANPIMSLQPHILKRTLFIDEIHLNAQRQYLGSKIDGYQTTYALGPKVAYEAAAQGLLAAPGSPSSRTRSPLNQLQNQLPHSSNKSAGQSSSNLRPYNNAIYYSLISVDCDEDQLFENVSSQRNANLLSHDNFIRVSRTLIKRHLSGIVHCDVRGPNLVVQDKLLNLVDTEYSVWLKEEGETQGNLLGQQLGVTLSTLITTKWPSLRHLKTLENANKFFQASIQSCKNMAQLVPEKRELLLSHLRLASRELRQTNEALKVSVDQSRANGGNMALIKALLPGLKAANLEEDLGDQISTTFAAISTLDNNMSLHQHVQSLPLPKLLRLLDYYGVMSLWFPGLCSDYGFQSSDGLVCLAKSMVDFFDLQSHVNLDTFDAQSGTIFDQLQKMDETFPKPMITDLDNVTTQPAEKTTSQTTPQTAKSNRRSARNHTRHRGMNQHGVYDPVVALTSNPRTD